MPLNFASAANKAKPAAQQTAAPKQQSQSTSSPASFLMKGAAAKQAMAHEEAKAEMAKQEAGKLFRFWLPEDAERQITFLDGEVDSEGMLDIPMYYEHQVKVNGNWTNFPCTQETQGFCPICNKGESKSSLVGIMTIIDHTPYKVESGKNAGKVYENTKRLFVPKKITVMQLSKIAVKRGGLTGCTFDVSRSGDKSASVGSQFDFVSKASLSEIAQKYGLEPDYVQPANYDEEIVYRTPEELVELGVGKPMNGPGFDKKTGGPSKSSLSDQM